MSFPFYRFFPGDYMRDTMHLGWYEDLAYRRLIDLYLLHGKPIRNDRAYLLRAVRAFEPEQQAAVDMVLAEMFELRADGWHQKRCDAEVDRQRERSATATELAKRRWDAKAMPRHSEGICDGNANQNQNQNQNQEPKPPKGRTVVGAAKAPPRKRLPDDWKLPKDWGDWALTERQGWTPEHVRRVAAMFADHWHSKAEARADWLATWRNWVRNDRGMGIAGKETQADKRAKVAAAMYAHRTKEQPDDAIDSTAKRLD
jgi:uncharacterized protein YdaU (DUF1376 family)